MTETAITKALRDSSSSGKRLDLSDLNCPGLRLRVTPTGAIRTKDKASWVLACRDRLGGMRRFPLGSYPDMGISDAREAARNTHAQVKDGADPIAQRKKDRAMGHAARLGVGTLSAMLDAYGTKHGRKSWTASRKRVDLVFHNLLQRPLATLTLSDFQFEADGYAYPKSAAFAVRTIRPALKWAAAPGREYLTGDMAKLTAPARLQRRERVLSRDELKKILPHISESEKPFPAAHYFMLLTLARREEVAQATWGNVDLAAKTWTIPATKNGQPHIVPLSPPAIDLLHRMQPSRPAELVFHTKGLKPLKNWDRATKALHKESKTAAWSRHDLRRTGATMLGDLGVLPDIVEAALNHVAIRSTLAATYNRSRYRPQVAAALSLLADALQGIVTDCANVTNLDAARKRA